MSPDDAANHHDDCGASSAPRVASKGFVLFRDEEIHPVHMYGGISVGSLPDALQCES